MAADPDYAEAHAQLALKLIQGAALGSGAGDLAVGVDQARQAIRLQPDLALGYRALSFGLAVGGDYAGGLQAAERSVYLNANDPESLPALAKAQLRFGSYEEATRNASWARALHPMAPDYFAFIEGQALYASDRLDEAADVIRDCLIGIDQRANCLRIAAAVDVRRGKVDDAREFMRLLMSVEPTFTLEKEWVTQRYGTMPVTRRYLDDLAKALPPRSATVEIGAPRPAS